MARRRSQRGRAVPASTRQEPPETNPALRAAIMEIVDTQLRERNPPETWATLERLIEAGYTGEGARQLIAQAVVNEIWSVMSSGQRYDEARYLAALRRLPESPLEE
jgi:cytochrome P450